MPRPFPAHHPPKKATNDVLDSSGSMGTARHSVVPSTGFINAAFTDWKLTVSKAISIVNAPALAKLGKLRVEFLN